MMVFSYSRTMAGAKRLAEQHGRSFPAIEPPKPKPAPVAVPVAVAKPAKPVAGLTPRNVVVNFTPRTKAQQIIADMAHQHGLTYGDIMGKSRRDPIVAARHAAIAAVYLNCRIDGCRYSLPKLGRVFGLDHTSCLFALRKMGIERDGRPT
jgi:hypothetical protein